MPSPHLLIAVLPCNDLEVSAAFYRRLGFTQDHQPDDGTDGGYRILSDGKGAHLHLAQAVAGWLVPGRNPFGLYLYVQDVDALAAAFVGEMLEPSGPEEKPWGMYEFSLSDPDDTLVRVGRPLR